MEPVTKAEIRAAAKTQAGQTLLRALVEAYGYTNVTTFVAGDPCQTAWHEGQRSVVVSIGQWLEEAADPRPIGVEI